jgi:endonuclease YncB( thermonuclease family)
VLYILLLIAVVLWLALTGSYDPPRPHGVVRFREKPDTGGDHSEPSRPSVYAPRRQEWWQERWINRVIDGDTVELFSGERVRMVGIDAPESVHPEKPPEPYGEEASLALWSLLSRDTYTVNGARVWLEFTTRTRDVHGRTLAYLYRASDGMLLDAEMARIGAARAWTGDGDPHEVVITQLERAARTEKLGMWSDDWLAASPMPKRAKAWPTYTETEENTPPPIRPQVSPEHQTLEDLRRATVEAQMARIRANNPGFSQPLVHPDSKLVSNHPEDDEIPF